MVAQHLRKAAVDEALADDSASDNAMRWALADHLGTIREVVNNSGAVVDHIAYNSFGEVTNRRV